MSLILDFWKESKKKADVLRLTGHYIHNWKLKSFVLGAFEFHQHHRSVNIMNTTKEIPKKWDISLDKIVAIVTDGAANITKAVKDLFGEKKHIYCFGNLLNVVLSYVFHINQEIYSVLKKIQDIIMWFRLNSLAHYVLKGMSELCLLNWTPIKWNSAYMMLKRFIEMIQSLMLSPSVLTTTVEVLSVKEIIPILEIFFDITTKISAEKQVTISKLLAMQDYMLTNIEFKDITSNKGVQFKAVIFSELKRVSNFKSTLIIGLPFPFLTQGINILNLTTVLMT